MQMWASFKKRFGRPLDDFWGREGKDLDGEKRRQPSNVTGFDYEAFVRAFKIKVDSRLPIKSLRKPLLSAVKAKYGDDGHQVVSGLLGLARAPKKQIKEKAGTDSD
jgi:hypothetical protein